MTDLWPWLKSNCLGFVNYCDDLTDNNTLVVKEPSRHRWSSPPHFDQQKGKKSVSSPGSSHRAPPLKKSNHISPGTHLWPCAGCHSTSCSCYVIINVAVATSSAFHSDRLTPSMWPSLTSVSSPLRLSGSVLVTGSRRTGWPETAGSKWVTKGGRTQDKVLNQSLKSCTADEGALWSTQWLHAGPPRQDLHPEPTLLLRRDLWRCGRPPMVPQQLSPSSFSCIWRFLTAKPTLND